MESAIENNTKAVKGSHRRMQRILAFPPTVFIIAFFILFFVCALKPVMPEVIYRVDPLALLAATLRTYQRAGCDSEVLSLNCPRGTSISIELAQYGRAGDLSDHSLCPPVPYENQTTTGGGVDDSTAYHGGTEIEVKPPETCTVSELQYALLQSVVDACQKKRHCKFTAIPKTDQDAVGPCSGIRKFVEIAYKCRPYEFRSKVACENDNMPLVCNPYSRIAIYSASFGHTQRETIHCGNINSQAGPEDSNHQTCQVSYATETVMQVCHGRRRCSVSADANTFGRPCRHDVRMYLKVVYTCIPRKVLKDRYETDAEPDEPHQAEIDVDQDELYDEDQFYKESEAIPPAPKLQGAIPNPAIPYDFGVGGEGPQSTLLPPLLSRNESSLEVDTSSTANWYVDSDLGVESNDLHSSFVPDTTLPGLDSTETLFAPSVDNCVHMGKNFFYRRRCETRDDWGLIGLNCTREDYKMERVEVIGFLANWMEAYAHIRKNQEQFYLYLIISVAAGVLLCLTLVIGRLTLQRRRTHRNNGTADRNDSGMHCDGGVTAKGPPDAKHSFSVVGETKLPQNSDDDDISDIDADIDLTSPMSIHFPSAFSRNEAYMAYAPTSSCTYGTLQPPHSTSSILSPDTMLIPTSNHGGLLVSGHSNPLGGPGAPVDTRQSTPPPRTFYTNMGGICPATINGSVTMGPHLLTPSSLSAVSQPGTPSYLTGSMMVPGHNYPHPGTLRRTMMPTGMGSMNSSSMHLSTASGAPLSLSGIPSATHIYYDSTIPRNLNRGISTDCTQFYG